MNKNGFSLIELLLVVGIVAFVTISSVITFGETSKASKEEKMSNTYLDIQRAAKIYLDLNDSWIREFNRDNMVYISIGELISKNYTNNSIGDSVKDLGISNSCLVKVYLTDNGNGYVDTCIIDIKNSNGDDKEICISNSDGESEDCCIK